MAGLGGQTHGTDSLAGREGRRLVEGGTLHLHVEQVDLAVDGSDRTVGTEHAAGAAHPGVG